MTTTNSVTNNTAAETFAALNGNSGKTKTSGTADMQNNFLTMLTTQLKNQDPLNPLDNAQVTTQLAQINTVSGIERLNETLGKLLGAYDNSQAMQSSSLIGKGVLVEGNNLFLSGGVAGGGIKLAEAADQVTINVLDASGKVIQSQNLGAREAGVFSFAWDGQNDAGEKVADGAYKFSVEAFRGSEKTEAAMLQAGMVSAVTRSNSGFVLDLGGLGQVKFDDVQQII